MIAVLSRFAKIGSWEYELNSQKLTWSKEVYSIFGLDESYVPNVKDLAHFIHPDDHWVVAPETIKRNTEAGIQEMEYRIIDQTTNEIKYVIGKGETYKDPDCKLIKNFGSFQDITERRKREFAIKESEQKFRTIFEQAAVGFAMIDTGSSKFVKTNTKYAEIIGYTVSEMQEIDFISITHPDDIKADLDNMKLLQTGVVSEFSMQKRYFHKNGDIIWVNLFVSPLQKEDNRITTHIAIIEDIRSRKKAEKELSIKAKELEQFNKIMIDREVRIIEMKEEVNDLCRQLGRNIAYEEIWK